MDPIIYWPKLGHEYSCSLYLCKFIAFLYVFFLSEVKLPRKIGFLSMNSSKVLKLVDVWNIREDPVNSTHVLNEG